MKITAKDLKSLKIIDDIIKEPEGGAQEDFEKVTKSLKKYLEKNIKELKNIQVDELLEKRYEKIRNFGRNLD